MYISFYHEKLEEEESEETQNLAVTISSVAAYIGFAIVIIPIALLLLAFCNGDSTCFTLIDNAFSGVEIYPLQKLRAIYLCKKE